MRIPRLRFTISWLMVAMAIGGIGIWIPKARERSRHCSWVAYFHAEEAQYSRDVADSPPFYDMCGTYLASMTPEQIRLDRESRPSAAEYRAEWLRRAEYHLHAKEKFERAAWRPWEALPDIPPDPPEL